MLFPVFFLFIAKKQFLRNTLVCCNILMTLFIIDVINVIKKNIGYMCHRVNLPDKVYRYTLYALVILNELMWLPEIIFRFFSFKERGEVIDEELTRAFARVKRKFNDYDQLREAFYDVRDDITEVMKTCSDNVRVVVYIDDVLDDPIIVGIGAEENRLRISIRSNGKASYSWTKETWSKIFRDGWEGVKSLTKKILGFIASKARAVFAIAKEILPALTFLWNKYNGM